MGETIIARRSCSIQGRVAENALIYVSYPNGSVCTCTDGTTVLTAEENESNLYCFVLPNIGTWTVEATYGAHTDSKTIEITSVSDKVNVTLKYEFVLLSSANGLADGYGINGQYITPQIDVTPYNTVTIQMYVSWASAVGYGSGIYLSAENGVSSSVGFTMNEIYGTSTQTKSIDISNMSGMCSIYFNRDASMSGNSIYIDGGSSDSYYHNITFT